MTTHHLPTTVAHTTPNDTATSISVRDLRVVRDGNRILRDISLTVPRGVVFGLVGPSGSGKTTFIRSLIGRQQIAGGEITIDGLPAGSSELRSRIGYMPQETAVYPDLTGRENLQFFASIYRTSHDRIAEVVELLDMQAVIDRPITTYSGGQRQRVSLAVALLPDPQFLLLDEPTVGLDPQLRQRLWAGFASLAARGSTLLVSTHVMDEAAHADQLAFFSEGEVVASGTPQNLLDRTGTDNLEDAVLALTTSREAK